MSKAAVFWIAARHAGKCKCGADVPVGARAEYDFASQSYIKCSACGSEPAIVPAPTPVAAVIAAPVFVPPDVPPAPAIAVSPLAILENAARCFAPAGDVRRIVDAMILAGVRAAWESEVR